MIGSRIFVLRVGVHLEAIRYHSWIMHSGVTPERCRIQKIKHRFSDQLRCKAPKHSACKFSCRTAEQICGAPGPKHTQEKGGCLH